MESDTGDGDSDGDDTCTPSRGIALIDRNIRRDESTCLTWTRTVVGQDENWPRIKSSCASLELGSFDDWRMPTTREVPTWPQSLAPGTYWDAALTSPRYVPHETPPADIEGSFQVCAVARFNGLDASRQWWGSANTNGSFCVRGEGTRLPQIPDACASTCTNTKLWDVVED